MAELAWSPKKANYADETIRPLESNHHLPSDKNILLVKDFLGHAKLENTLLYIQVEQAIFGADDNDNFTIQATNNKEEIKQLLSAGFEYVCQKDDTLFFRKPK